MRVPGQVACWYLPTNPGTSRPRLGRVGGKLWMTQGPQGPKPRFTVRLPSTTTKRMVLGSGRTTATAARSVGPDGYQRVVSSLLCDPDLLGHSPGPSLIADL